VSTSQTTLSEIALSSVSNDTLNFSETPLKSIFYDMYRRCALDVPLPCISLTWALITHHLIGRVVCSLSIFHVRSSENGDSEITGAPNKQLLVQPSMAFLASSRPHTTSCYE
jgi:hypothetical protein